VASGASWSFRTPGNETSMAITGTGGNGAFIEALEGAFNPAGPTATAVLAPFGRCFNGASQRLRFSGTSTGPTLDLTSLDVGGQVIRITGTLSDDGSRFSGTLSGSGGCSNGHTSAVVGQLVNLDAVWKNEQQTHTIKIGSTPTDGGAFAIEGTAAIAGTACYPDATINGYARGRLLFQDITSGGRRLEYISEVSEDLTRMNYIYVLAEGQCPEAGMGGGQLIRQ